MNRESYTLNIKDRCTCTKLNVLIWFTGRDVNLNVQKFNVSLCKQIDSIILSCPEIENSDSFIRKNHFCITFSLTWNVYSLNHMLFISISSFFYAYFLIYALEMRNAKKATLSYIKQAKFNTRHYVRKSSLSWNVLIDKSFIVRIFLDEPSRIDGFLWFYQNIVKLIMADTSSSFSTLLKLVSRFLIYNLLFSSDCKSN